MAKIPLEGWPVGTSAIVRLEGWNRMVTKGYRKGVYNWVTKGIRGLRSLGGGSAAVPAAVRRTSRRLFWQASANVLFGGDEELCNVPAALERARLQWRHECYRLGSFAARLEAAPFQSVDHGV